MLKKIFCFFPSIFFSIALDIRHWQWAMNNYIIVTKQMTNVSLRKKLNFMHINSKWICCMLWNRLYCKFHLKMSKLEFCNRFIFHFPFYYSISFPFRINNNENMKHERIEFGKHFHWRSTGTVSVKGITKKSYLWIKSEFYATMFIFGQNWRSFPFEWLASVPQM